MPLTAEQHARRDGKVGASFAPHLMAGDQNKMVQEWMRLVGHPDYAPEDLSRNWPVQFGSFIEPFALDWHVMKTGKLLTHLGEWVSHPELPHVGATLDAYRPDDATVIDCKAPGAHRRLDDVLAFYPSQLVVQRACMKADAAALLIVHGGAEPTEYTVTWDEDYEREVWARVAWFWNCVETLQPPGPLPKAKDPVSAARIVDMNGNNEWGFFARQWLVNKQAATDFNAASKTLKSLMEPDVSKAFGHGIQATRARNGAITIKEGR
jgi:hypothetical protein